MANVAPTEAMPQTPPDEREAETKKIAERIMRLDALAASLQREAIRTWGLRQTIEERWLEDLRNYNGTYDEETIKRIKSYDGSSVFVNVTRAKTKTAQARLADMLFPTDDRNWDIKPTPVPELIRMSKSSKPLYDERGRVRSTPPDENGQTRPLTEADRARMLMRKAREKSNAMGMEIEDQLVEAKYSIKCRRAIHDACTLGTGVIKGPIVVGRTRKMWTQKPVQQEPQQRSLGNRVMDFVSFRRSEPKDQGMESPRSISVLETVTDTRPSVEHVDIWNFFPDMAAATMDECRFVFERKYLTSRQLAELGTHPYYIAENIVRALTAGSKASHFTRNPTMEKRDAASANTGDSAPQTETELFELWEYHGPIDVNDLRAAGVEGVTEEMEGLTSGCVVFVGNVVIKAYLNPLETGTLPYKVFNYENDEASVFGYGVPYRMRNSQKVINAAWRALMDNTALSVGPQIVVNRRAIQPSDGDYRIRARKVWETTDTSRSVRDVFASFNIDSHQEELQSIIQMSMRFADEETGLPLIAQGEQGPHITKTAQGMSILMNSANTVTRDTVKNFDDGVTTPMIQDFYDWNMQYSSNDEIKGDYEVDARGSSVLLSKELQSQNLMALAANFAGNPIFGPMIKPLQLFRKIVQSMHVSAEDIVVTDAEYEEHKANAGQSEDPVITAEKMRQEYDAKSMQQKQQHQAELENAKFNNRMQEMQADRELELLRMSNERGITLDKLRAMLADTQLKGNQKRLQISDEAKIKNKFGEGI